MWRCKNCGEILEDQFDACWKCADNKEEGAQEFLLNTSESSLQTKGGSLPEDQDELLYLEATNEIEANIIDKALWAKAMALCEGDEKRAKYRYVVLRVAQEKRKMAESAEPTTNEPPTLPPAQPKVEIGDGIGLGGWLMILFLIAYLGFLYMAGESPF